jgi:hypothetical protein
MEVRLNFYLKNRYICVVCSKLKNGTLYEVYSRWIYFSYLFHH